MTKETASREEVYGLFWNGEFKGRYASSNEAWKQADIQSQVLRESGTTDEDLARGTWDVLGPGEWDDRSVGGTGASLQRPVRAVQVLYDKQRGWLIENPAGGWLHPTAEFDGLTATASLDELKEMVEDTYLWDGIWAESEIGSDAVEVQVQSSTGSSNRRGGRRMGRLSLNPHEWGDFFDGIDRDLSATWKDRDSNPIDFSGRYKVYDAGWQGWWREYEDGAHLDASFEDATVYTGQELVERHIAPVGGTIIERVGSKRGGSVSERRAMFDDGPVIEFEFYSHGVDSPSYFQGSSTSFTEWDDVFVGIGGSEREAAEDAVEHAATAGCDISQVESQIDTELTLASDEDAVQAVMDEYEVDADEVWGSGEGLYFYVSFYVKYADSNGVTGSKSKRRAAGYFTVEMAEEEEKESLQDALFNGSFQLNDDFLQRYAGENVRNELMRVEEWNRAGLLEQAIDDWDDCHFLGFLYSSDDAIILGPVHEIEVQFEGSPEDFFADPDDWHIDGDLAYCSTGYGLYVPVNVAELKRIIDEHLQS